MEAGTPCQPAAALGGLTAEPALRRAVQCNEAYPAPPQNNFSPLHLFCPAVSQPTEEPILQEELIQAVHGPCVYLPLLCVAVHILPLVCGCLCVFPCSFCAVSPTLQLLCSNSSLRKGRSPGPNSRLGSFVTPSQLCFNFPSKEAHLPAYAPIITYSEEVSLKSIGTLLALLIRGSGINQRGSGDKPSAQAGLVVVSAFLEMLLSEHSPLLGITSATASESHQNAHSLS